MDRIFLWKKGLKMKTGKGTLILCGALCFLTAIAIGQDIAKVAGTWDVTVQSRSGTIKEQWIIQTDGKQVTGTVKSARGDLQLVAQFTGNNTFKGSFKTGDVKHIVLVTLDGDSFTGNLSQANEKGDGQILGLLRGIRSR